MRLFVIVPPGTTTDDIEKGTIFLPLSEAMICSSPQGCDFWIPMLNVNPVAYLGKRFGSTKRAMLTRTNLAKWEHRQILANLLQETVTILFSTSANPSHKVIELSYQPK